MLSAETWDRTAIGVSAARAFLAAALFAAFLLALGTGVAGAFSLRLSGPTGAPIGLDDANALYAGDAFGKEVLIAKVGDRAPGGPGAIEDLGLPSLTPDGKVLFGAALRDPHRNRYVWKILVGDPNAAGNRVRSAVDLDALVSEDCVPNLNSDPGPVSDGNGGAIFTGREAGGKDALFLFSGGRLGCIARKGDQVEPGHKLALISFGTAQIGAGGEIVLLGWVEHDRQAVLLALRDGRIKALAVEDEPGPEGAIYRRHSRFASAFSPPSTLPSSHGTVVALTADTSAGRRLFEYRDRRMHKVLGCGCASAPVGRVTYLSQARPGLMADGTVAVLSAFGKDGYAVVRVNQDGKPRVILRSGEPTRSGAKLVALGDPFLTATGVMILSALNSEDREAIYSVYGNRMPSELGLSDVIRTAMEFEAPAPGHKIYGATLAINQHGDFAYLGGT